MNKHQKQHGMNDNELAQLAGYLDGTGTISMVISKEPQYNLGYGMTPVISINPKHDDDLMQGKLLKYCEKQDIDAKIQQGSSNPRIRIEGQDSVERFLEPLMEHLVTKFEQASLLLHEILPRMDDGHHLQEETFIKLMELVDKLRSYNQNRGTNVKYDREHFVEEWGEVAT
jgi:hypothetical protein